MFGSVRKMVSAFETRKQPCPLPPSHSSPTSSTQNPSPNQQSPPPSTTPTPGLKTLPCLSTTSDPHPTHNSGHAPSAHLILQRGKQDVLLRRGGEGRRIPRIKLRDSWPMGKLNCFERNFLSFVTVETKEPINCSKCPPEFDRSRLRPIRCKSSSTAGLNTSSTTGPKSTIGTNANSALSSTASVTRGTYSHFTTETSSKLTIGASASANSDKSELLLSLGRRCPVPVGGKSAFEPPGASVHREQVVLGNAATVTQSGGRGQGKVQAFHPQLELRPSDSAFFSLLLLLRR